MNRALEVNVLRDQRGSGTVLALAGVALLITLFAVVHLLGSAAVAAAQAARGADLAALAGADAARGLVAGDPCTVAEEVTVRNQVRLLSCTVGGTHGTDVTVEVSAPVTAHTAELLQARGTSRAGAPAGGRIGLAPDR